jgi:hypothetical protein
VGRAFFRDITDWLRSPALPARPTEPLLLPLIRRNHHICLRKIIAFELQWG